MKERSELLSEGQDVAAVTYKMRKLANNADVALKVETIDSESYSDALTTMFLHHGLCGTVKYAKCSTIMGAISRAIAEDPKCCSEFQVYKYVFVVLTFVHS